MLGIVNSAAISDAEWEAGKMIVTRKHLPRRTFLKGVGTAIALPWLDAMVPAFAAQAKLRCDWCSSIRPMA